MFVITFVQRFVLFRRREDEEVQVILYLNLPGGSAPTDTSVHVAWPAL